MKIPRKYADLRRYAALRTLLRAVGFLAWQILWIGSAISYNQNHQTYPDHRRFVGWRMALVVALAVVSGFLLFRLWRLYTDRTLCGVILSAGLSRSYNASGDPGASKTDYDFRLNTTLLIQTENGKKKRLRFEQKNGFYQYYHEGNRIVRFRGLTYPLLLDPTAPHGYVCSACGRWTATHTPQCEQCKHSLIAPRELCEEERQ